MLLGGFDKPRELLELLLEFRRKLGVLLVSPRGAQLLHLLGKLGCRIRQVPREAFEQHRELAKLLRIDDRLGQGSTPRHEVSSYRNQP